MTRQPHIYKTLFLCLLLFAGCRKDLYDVPLPSEITKSHRASIGKYVLGQITTHATVELLNVTEHNAAAFDLVQQLYNQVTNEMRLDNKSPDWNRWSANRDWKVHIISDEDHTAFVLPGGDLIISTGLLLSLETESELYSILATEAILMNEKYLLEKMITNYSTRLLVQMAEGQEITDARVETVFSELPMFNYEIDESEAIKIKVSELICNTSIYAPTAVSKLPALLSSSGQWIQTRPNGLSKTDISNCGKLESNGLYKSMILDVL